MKVHSNPNLKWFIVTILRSGQKKVKEAKAETAEKAFYKIRKEFPGCLVVSIQEKPA